ncbi:MAG TPA: SGNH/GDSL hydrolase family protein [Frankiaceae bacterium]|nr:SGNH/GDSL hydrolase family protein [Frankiaceae bacterium]
MRLRNALMVAFAAAAVLAGSGTAHAIPPIPSSMSSLGDSITKGFNACGWYSDCADRSWSTGGYASVNSHYLRIRAKNSAINARNFNDARTGARMSDLNAQAQAAVSRGVSYVTILMGANDACTSSESTMTPVSTYRAQLDAALATLKNGLPNAAVFISSVPDIKRLWFIGKDSSSARNAWSGFKICQSMLANPQSTAQVDVDRRARVQQRVIDFNTQLAQACTAYGANCDFDGNAVFNYPFVLGQVSSWDYFHPNTSGQAVLASISYPAGFNW